MVTTLEASFRSTKSFSGSEELTFYSQAYHRFLKAANFRARFGKSFWQRADNATLMYRKRKIYVQSADFVSFTSKVVRISPNLRVDRRTCEEQKEQWYGIQQNLFMRVQATDGSVVGKGRAESLSNQPGPSCHAQFALLLVAVKN
jgi:hypothetical protein